MVKFSVCVARQRYNKADYNQMVEKMVRALRWRMHLVAVSLSFRREDVIGLVFPFKVK